MIYHDIMPPTWYNAGSTNEGIKHVFFSSKSRTMADMNWIIFGWNHDDKMALQQNNLTQPYKTI